jgi:hypothetical protein
MHQGKLKMYCLKHFIYREAELCISKFQLLTKTINLKSNLDYLLYEIKNFTCDLTYVSRKTDPNGKMRTESRKK